MELNLFSQHLTNVTTVTETELIRDAAAGDRQAFGQLVAMHQDQIYRFLIRTLGSTADAQDVTQNTFLLAWRKLDQFRGDAKLTTWLTQIAVNQAASFRRKRKAKTFADTMARQGTEDRTVTISDEHQPAPSQRAETEERDQIVQQAIDRLSDEHREVLVLKEFQDHDYHEIASIVGCPIGTVRSRLHRARVELAELLAPHRDSLLIGT